MSSLQLFSPSLNLTPSYLEFMEEMRAIGETVWPPTMPMGLENHQQFVDRLLTVEHTPAIGMVCETQYWAVEDGRVVGRIAFRHVLNENLRIFGGHIGYEVRPSARRRGVASEMLRQLLQTPRARTVGKMLLTCSPENLGSIKTIKKNGGILQTTKYVDKIQRETSYYWIDLYN